MKRANGSQVFEEGTDYTVDANGLFSLTPESRIPVLDIIIMRGVTNPSYYSLSDTNGTPFYVPGGIQKYEDYEVVVTYYHDHAVESLDDLAVGHWNSKLTNSLDRLRLQQPVNITFFGDSITFGSQASLPTSTYAVKIVTSLKDKFGYDQISYANRAVGGKTSVWGLQEIQQVIDTAPDIVVLAFGMNDASGGMPSAAYKQNTEGMIQALRAANPDVDIVLVAEFSPILS